MTADCRVENKSSNFIQYFEGAVDEVWSYFGATEVETRPVCGICTGLTYA
jgi:hypothetical protein